MDGSELWTLDSTSGNHIIVYLNVSEMLQIDGIRPHIECLNSNVTILTDKVEQTVTGPVTTPAEDQVADYDRCAWAKADSKDIYVKFPKSVVGGDTIAHWKTYLLNNNLIKLTKAGKPWRCGKGYRKDWSKLIGKEVILHGSSYTLTQRVKKNNKWTLYTTTGQYPVSLSNTTVYKIADITGAKVEKDD